MSTENIFSRIGISKANQEHAFWNFLELVFNPFLSLILIPILTYNIGLENYGFYVLIISIASIFGFSGMGMNTSVTYEFAKNFKKNSAESMGIILSTAILISILGTIVFSITLFVLKDLILNFFAASKLASSSVFIVIIILIVSQLDSIISAALKGIHEFKLSSKSEIYIRGLSFFSLVITAFSTKNVTSILFVYVVNSIFGLIFRFRALQSISGLKFKGALYSRKKASELFNFGKWMSLQCIAASIFSTIDKIAISFYLGNTSVGIYNILVSLTQLIHFLPSSLVSFIMPKIATNPTSISFYKLNLIFLLTISLALTISLFLLVLSPFVFSYFSINEAYIYVFHILILSYFLLSLNIPSYFIALSLNLTKQVSFLTITSSILGMISMIYLVKSFGQEGAALSKIIYSSFSMLLIFPVIKKMR